MPKYLCVQRSLTAPDEEATAASGQSSPGDMAAKFQAWMTEFADNFVDLGGPLGPSKLVTHAEQRTDGPFVEVRELVGGYMVLTADDLAQATAVARACPGLVRPGSGVEIIEIPTP